MTATAAGRLPGKAEFAEARRVKGKTQPVNMYRVIGRKGAPESEKVRALFA